MKHKVFLAGILSIALVFGLVFTGCKSTSVQADAPRQSNSTETVIKEDVDFGNDIILTYSLSNSSTEIEKVILLETGKSIDLSKVRWNFKGELSEKEQAVMNKYNVKYSMTLVEGVVSHLFVYRRFNNTWYYYMESY